MKIDRYNSRLDVVWLGRCATPMCYTLHHERGQDARFSTVLENWRTRQDRCWKIDRRVEPLPTRCAPQGSVKRGWQ